MPNLTMQEETGTPATPATGKWRTYFKSDGMYILDDTGNELGPVITVESLAGISVAYKTADETVNNSSTLQNDDHLLFIAAPNKSYKVDIYVIVQTVTGSGNDDIKFGWSVPAGCTGYWGTADTNASVEGITPITGLTGTPLANQTLSASANYSTGAAMNVLMKFEAIILNGATQGTVNLQWAQNVAGARDLKILRGSTLIITTLN